MNTELTPVIAEVQGMIFYNLQAIANFMYLPVEQRIPRQDWLKKTVARTEMMIYAVRIVNQP
jgi:hypothetical protein